MRRLNPTAIALIAGVAILLLLVFLFTRGGNGDQDKLRDDQLAATEKRPDERCGSQRTYDAIKIELFRQASETRGSDQAVFDRLARFASLRVEQPVLKSRDEGVGTLRCSGRVSLDLPPGVAVVGGRRTLTTTMDYVLQPAADNSGDVVILEGADPIVVPLATLARTGNNVPLPNLPEPAAPAAPGAPSAAPPAEAPQPPAAPAAPAPPPRAAPPPEQPQPAPAAPQRTSASPSFNCRYARTRAEIAVCGDGGLAALDRQMASQYYRAVGSADARQRELLRSTRSRFLRYRDSCRSDACIAGAYRDRMVEIRDIMAGRWNPPR